MLKINNLSVKVSNKKILNNMDLTINDGEIHVIMGKNGIGKSSLCKVLMHDSDYEVINGNILFDNEDILKLDTNEIANKGIMFIMQNPPQIEGVTNAEMLRTVLRSRSNDKINIFEFNKTLEDLCDKLKLDKSFIHKDINVGASGGERKKIELLHMGVLKPKFIILDEIDSGLDVDALKVVSDYINEYHNQTKCSILMVTHHNNILNYIKPNFVHILENGKIIKTGDYHLAESIEKEGFEANVLSKDDAHE